LHSLYENDVVGEDAILEWADSLQNESAEDKVFLKQCEKFLTWLKEAEEDEDEQEEEEEEEDE
jgi:translation initiation factor eIF-2B subunit epsilon